MVPVYVQYVDIIGVRFQGSDVVLWCETARQLSIQHPCVLKALEQQIVACSLLFVLAFCVLLFFFCSI